MTEIIEVNIRTTRSAIALLQAAANVGFEGAEGNLADIDDVGDILDQLEAVENSSDTLFVIDQTEDLGDAQGSADPDDHFREAAGLRGVP